MWYAKEYEPIKVGSIDGTDTTPHDAAIQRATLSEHRPPTHLHSDPTCTLFVGRLSFDTTEDALKHHFDRHGAVTKAVLKRDKVTGLSRGYGFITYESRYSARKAYDELNQSVLDSHVIFVDYERNRTMKGWVPRRLGGGFGGRKQSGQLRFGARDRPFRTPSSKHISSELKRSTVWKYL